MIKLNHQLSVWQKHQQIIITNDQFLMIRTQKRVRGQIIHKTIANLSQGTILTRTRSGVSQHG